MRRLWQALERPDARSVFALYDPAIVWDSRHLSPIELRGLYHGHEGVRQFFRQWLESFESFDARAETFIDAGDKVIVGIRLHGRGKVSGVAVEMPRWNVYGIRKGLIVSVELFETEAEALAAAGLS